MKAEILHTLAKLQAPGKHTVQINLDTQTVLIQLPFLQILSHKDWIGILYGPWVHLSSAYFQKHYHCFT